MGGDALRGYISTVSSACAETDENGIPRYLLTAAALAGVQLAQFSLHDRFYYLWVARSIDLGCIHSMSVELPLLLMALHAGSGAALASSGDRTMAGAVASLLPVTYSFCRAFRLQQGITAPCIVAVACCRDGYVRACWQR